MRYRARCSRRSEGAAARTLVAGTQCIARLIARIIGNALAQIEEMRRRDHSAPPSSMLSQVRDAFGLND